MKFNTLSKAEICELLSSPVNHASHIIGARSATSLQLVHILTADFLVIAVPYRFFNKNAQSQPMPDFTHPIPADQGRTLKLGEYEAAASIIIEQGVR